MRLQILLITLISLIGCGSPRDSRFPNWGFVPEHSADWHDNFEKCKSTEYSLLWKKSQTYHELDRPEGESMGEAIAKYLIPSCLQAVVTRHQFRDKSLQKYNCYSLEVSYPHAGGDALLYLHELEGRKVGDFFKGKSIDDVVNFGSSTGIVRFTVGNDTYTYQIPRQ